MSPDVVEIFVADARKYAGRLRDALDPQMGGPNAEAVRRAARRLHHSALLANQSPVLHATAALQKVAIQVMAGDRGWSEGLTVAMTTVISELDALVNALPASNAAGEARLEEAAQRLIGEGDELSTPSNEELAGGAPDLRPEGDGAGPDEGERELQALIADLGDAVERLANDPRDREPLKSILRRIRRLRDLERIALLSSPDKALTAVEELILQIADLNATVGPGYLTVFRHARKVLEEMRASPEARAATSEVGDRAIDVDELKEQVIQTARRSRQVPWVSDLFFPEGPHIVACPLAEREAGSQEEYFVAKATERLDRSESLRKEMLEASAEQMRLIGESLSLTLRHLRERAAAFNHPDVGRITRRAAAAVRAQLVRPPSRLRALAEGIGDVFSALRSYLETDDEPQRAQAVTRAEEALHAAVLDGGTETDAEETDAEEVEFDPDRAIHRVLSIRTRLDERLERLTGPDADRLRQDLEELFDLLSYYATTSTPGG